MSHPLYWIALQIALGIPSRKLKVLLDFFGSAEGVFEASPHELKCCSALTEKERNAILAKPFRQAREIWDTCEAAGIFVLTPDDPGYPVGLWNIPDLPCVLYGKGSPLQLDRVPAVSIVGTRKPTTYGDIVCRRISSVLATAGVTVISGGALGLDAAAHEAALAVGGQTIAVLGSGIESKYLRANRPLREEISRHGTLLSEYPPKAPATRYTFPARNRLIAALSLGTVVIEAGEKSGSLITADYALEQGKDVFAVPGSVMSPHYTGSNRLIAEGATPVFSGLDVLAYYRKDFFGVLRVHAAEELHRSHMAETLVMIEPLENPKAKTNEKADSARKSASLTKNIPSAAGKDLSEPAQLVYNTILDANGIRLAELVERTGMDAPKILRELTKLEMDGRIEKDPTGKYTVAISIEE